MLSLVIEEFCAFFANYIPENYLEVSNFLVLIQKSANMIICAVWSMACPMLYSGVSCILNGLEHFKIDKKIKYLKFRFWNSRFLFLCEEFFACGYVGAKILQRKWILRCNFASVSTSAVLSTVLFWKALPYIKWPIWKFIFWSFDYQQQPTFTIFVKFQKLS